MRGTTTSTAVAPQEGTRAYPILDGFSRLGCKPVTGYGLVNSGELETFTIGARRYVTEEALRRFIEKRIAESFNESAKDRAKKVQKAVAGRARRRDEQIAA